MLGLGALQGWHPMYYMRGWWMMGMWLFWLVLLVVIAWVWIAHRTGPGRGAPRETPEEILRRRYARGEIDEPTYQHMRDQIRRDRDAA